MHEPRFGARRILSPILYAASVPTMFVLSFLLIPLLVGRPPMVWVFGVLGFGLVGTSVFVVFNACLAHIEHMKSPGILDHLRYCAILYAGLVPLGFFTITGYNGRYCRALQWTLGATLLPVATYAIVLNALIVYVLRQRYPTS